MALPTQYEWLNKESGPAMLTEALKLFGTVEALGPLNNPAIIAWAKEIGGNVEKIYKADEIPWCALFIAVIAKRSGNELVKDPLWALNWGTFGVHSDVPMLGDVMVFVRKTADGKKAGHVALYVGEDATSYHVLGGNQSDCVCITRLLKTRLYTSRRPAYQIQAPNIRVVSLASSGKVSVDEA